MKASIKLVISEKSTTDGYPVYVKICHGKIRVKECVAHSLPEDWGSDKNLPYKHHPNYYEILPIILEYKAKIKKINFGKYNIEEAKAILFSVKKAKSSIFYDAGLKECDASKTGKLYKTVLKSFNGVYSGVLTDDITPKMVNSYMNLLLKVNKPNGVYTYLSKLDTIYGRVSNKSNPFKGIRPRKVKTQQKTLVEADLKKIINTCTIKHKFDARNTNETINHYRYYWLLMFYLGGIDFIDLANMRYDLHVIDGRVQFYRSKGGTEAFVNNIILPEAKALLKKFDCYPYLVPIYKARNLDDFRNNMNERFIERTKDLKLTQRPLTKAARYTFINRARQLMIDERICIEIVGHEQQTTHSIYTDEYPLCVRDKAHEKIVRF